MITIIVPVYNVEKVIGRCIESVISQVYHDWELILVDDGSCDNSGAICDGYALKNKNIRVIHQENQGPSIARNAGIQAAQGEYLCFVDSDDYISPNYLEDFHIGNDIDFSVQGMKLVYTNGRKNETYKPQKFLSCTLNEALKEPSIYVLLYGPCCKIFKTSIIRDAQIFFPKNVHYGEDRIFVLKYLQNCKRKIQLSPFANYTYTHENNSSLTSQKKISTDLMQSTLLQFRELQNLANTTKASMYFLHYRKELMLDTYQSIYNNILENKFKLGNIISFVRLLDKDLLKFIRKEHSQPKTFRIIKIIVALFRIGL